VRTDPRAPVPLLAALLILLPSTGASGLAAQSSDGAARGGVQSVPALDTTQHAVPLDRIVFDTFRPGRRAVPLPEASPELIRRLRDAIPPLHEPEYVPAKDATWLEPDELVVGYAMDGEAWAFPTRILDLHEIVNDRLAGDPVLVTWCPLCGSGVVFDRRVDDRVLRFGNTSALYQSDMVMLDYQTGSYWWQVAGRAIVGPLTERSLEILPAVTATWREWREAHPRTLVLTRDTGFDRSYARRDRSGYERQIDRGRFLFPVGEEAHDERLSPGDRVLTVEAGDSRRAYPLEGRLPRLVADTVGGEPVVLFLAEDGSGGAAFRPVAGDERLEFEVRDGQIVDRATGSRWTLAGRAATGPLEGTRLEPLPTRTSYWFALVSAAPGVELYRPPRGR